MSLILGDTCLIHLRMKERCELGKERAYTSDGMGGVSRVVLGCKLRCVREGAWLRERLPREERLTRGSCLVRKGGGGKSWLSMGWKGAGGKKWRWTHFSNNKFY
jgi:hypothetical protein